jgi:hypothetical protein
MYRWAAADCAYRRCVVDSNALFVSRIPLCVCPFPAPARSLARSASPSSRPCTHAHGPHIPSCPPLILLQRKCQPLGLILEEVEDGNGAVVKGFTEGSNGQRLGVKIGETLVACRCVCNRKKRCTFLPHE